MASASMQIKPIESIFSPGLVTTYTAADGSLVMSDTENTDIVIQYTDNTQYTFDDGSVTLTASLASDDSLTGTGLGNGMAVGTFTDVRIDLYDNSGGLLFGADLSDIVLAETVWGVQPALNGNTAFQNGTGELLPLFSPSGIAYAKVFDMPDIPDFGSDFTGQSNMTLQVPEPATMSVLALGGLAVMLRKRSR
jgi:hypothetical protein